MLYFIKRKESRHSLAAFKMSEIHRLSVNNLMRVVGLSGARNKKVQWHSSEITIRQLLTIQEFIELVRKILDDCRTPDGGIAIELIDFSTRVNIISAYAYVDLPENSEKLYYVVYGSDLYDKVCSVANKAQLESIAQSVRICADHIGFSDPCCCDTAEAEEPNNG